MSGEMYLYFYDKRQETSSLPSTTPSPTSETTTTSEITTSDTSTTSDSTTSTTSDTSTTTTSPTETTTPPPDTSSSTSETSSSSSTPPSSSDTSTTSSGPLSTVVSTLVVTDNGQTSTQFITSAIASSTAGADGSSSGGGDDGGSSNTGAIIGGVIGGVAVLAVLALLVWFCLRRRKRNDFDGDFDPDSVAKRNSSTLQRLGRGEDTDLLAAVRGVENEPEVTPYTYGMQQHGTGGASLFGPATAAAAGAGAAAGYTAGGYGAHDQKSAASHPPSSYYDPNAPAMPSGPSETGSSGHGGVSDPRTSMSSSGVPYGASPYPPTAGAGAYGMYTPGPVPGANTPSSPTSQSHSTYGSSKEREAFAQRYAQQTGQGQNVLSGPTAATAANDGGIGPGRPPVPVPASLQPGGGLGGPGLTVRNASPIDEGAPDVVVHRDGGRVREEDVEPPNEIPPTYDSIRPDDDPAPTAARH